MASKLRFSSDKTDCRVRVGLVVLCGPILSRKKDADILSLVNAPRTLSCSCWLGLHWKCSNCFAESFWAPAVVVEYIVAVQFDALVKTWYPHRLVLIFDVNHVFNWILSLLKGLGCCSANLHADWFLVFFRCVEINAVALCSCCWTIAWPMCFHVYLREVSKSPVIFTHSGLVYPLDTFKLLFLTIYLEIFRSVAWK